MTTALAALFDRFAETKLLVLGDVMLDRFVYGGVERISAEAPVPVLRIQHEHAMPGGAGNVARNAAALGARVVLVGMVGDDEAGRELARCVAADPLVEARLVVEPGRPTTVKTRFVAHSQQVLRADREALATVSGAGEAALAAAVEAGLAGCSVLVISDYAKGTLSQGVLARAMAAAARLGLPVIADPKSRDLSRYRGATILKPNRHEVQAATGLECSDDAAAAAAALQVIRETGVAAVLLSRAEQGLTLAEAGGKVLHLPAEAREVFDVSGAGDTLVATVAVALAAGAELGEAAALANRAAGIVVGKVGTAVVHVSDLAAALQADAMHTVDSKVVPLAVALERVQAWRLRGERIGFTNGCFDLIHPGHVSLLAEARAACDRLVVGLNDDASVSRLKGPSRPVQNEAARAIVLASLGAVDLVVIFAEDTPIPLLQTLRPDVLVKGADYTMEQVVGGDLVRAYGGKVVLAGLKPGHSTTGTIARMNG